MEELKEKIVDRDRLKNAIISLKELYGYNYEKNDEKYNLKSEIDYKNEFVFLLSKHFYSKKVPFEFAKAIIEEIIDDNEEMNKRIKYLNHFYTQPLNEKEVKNRPII